MNKRIIVLIFLCTLFCEFSLQAQHSVAREWNEMLLTSIRNDLARPTVHARNLYHSSVAMYDIWSVYDNVAEPFFLGKTVDGYTCPFSGVPTPVDLEAAREEAISFAMYRLLSHRFSSLTSMLGQYNNLLFSQGYSPAVTSTDYTTGSPAALGNYIAEQLINFGLQDGSNETNAYTNTSYSPVNFPLVMDLDGNPDIEDFNRWQPLTLDVFIDQSGNVIPLNTPPFLSPEWGQVSPFAIQDSEVVTYQRDGFDYHVCLDPGMPPQLDIFNDVPENEEYQWNFALVSAWSSHLDALDPTTIDISPASIGNIQSYPTDFAGMQAFYDLENGGDASVGHNLNPHTGMPYQTQLVKRADYARVLAEFWADGPDSETPPGHWFTLLNYVSDHPEFEKRYEGTGDLLNDLEWDVKAYFTLGGAIHDAAITAWGCKGWYDYIRPVSAIRGMAELGQSSDPNLPSYNFSGLPLIPNYIELVEMGDPLAGSVNQNVGEIKIKAWRGPDEINNPSIDEAGVGWILAKEWWPFQRPSFVTPNFAGFVSGHSTFSRAAAEVMTALTGDAFFPGGMGEFLAPQNEFLVFEDGPSQDITLQWATYRDASDQCSLSRIWGGIHPPADDIPGRLMGIHLGINAFNFAKQYITANQCELQIPLNTGWNIISSNCLPENLDITDVFAAVSNELIQVKDLDNTYIPSFQFNGIGDWDITKSYQVKMTSSVTLDISNGIAVRPSETPINLETGWNAMAYLLKEESDPFVSLASISPNIVQVKDLQGSFLPTFSFSDLGNLSPGEGYQTKMSADDVLYYDENDGLGKPAGEEEPTNANLKAIPDYFKRSIPVNPFNATMLLLDETQLLTNGDEIGVFNGNNLLVGSGVYANGKVGLLIYGDDPSTPEQDGMIEGESYLVKIYHASTGEVKLADLEIIEGSKEFIINDLVVAQFKTNATTGIEALQNLSVKVGPNPTNSQLNFEIFLPENGQVDLGIYNIEGKKVEQLLEAEMGTGNYSIAYQVAHLTPGVYTYRFTLNGTSKVERFTVIH